MKIRRGHLRWKQVYNLEILGLGNDLIEIERIEKAVNRSDKFMEKIYSEKEREYLSDKKGFASYAGKFAAKEAVAKAMGTGVRGFAMSDIEILNDEMGKLCHAFEKMKDCLSKNNETMFRQFAEQRRLNAAFSHDLRTPLSLLKGHATMLLSFIPKGLVSQEEILDGISVMSKNISRLEKYVNAMTNLYRLEDIDIPRQQITFHSLIDNFNNTAEALCYDKHFSITTSGNNIALFINLDTVIQIYENLLSNSIRYAKSDIAISVVIENDNLVISVSDDGCGFKNIDIEKATLPFYKSSKDIATEHLGLGLNISKILSERHGGNIQIANNKAGGACVTVKINCNES